MRCVNIDWLEVYVFEPLISPITADSYRKRGFRVVERAFGTKIYQEVFTVYEGEHELIIVQRRPQSDKTHGGILQPGSCHIRMHNRFCYQRACVQWFRHLLNDMGYIFRSIKRVDLAIDFNKFDNNERPSNFARRYIAGDYVKICQPNISAHGVDNWDSREWNSLAWGSPSSNVRTRFYNKTLEMRQEKIKPWIIDAWLAAGLSLDEDVWRVEFELTNINNKAWESEDFTMMLQLSSFDTEEKIAILAQIYASHYFRFKIYEEGKRKDRCKDKILFKIDEVWRNYTPMDICFKRETKKADRSFLRKLYRIAADEFDKSPSIRNAVDEIVLYMCRHHGEVGTANSAYWTKLMSWGL